jgi:urea transporter
MDKLKQYGPIGAAIAVVSAIGAYLLPIPHAYSQIYSLVFGPAGCFVGYGLAEFLVRRADKWHVLALAAVAAISLAGTILCGFAYFHLYWLESSPALGARIVHALLYGFTFAFFFFTARWAGLLLSKKMD